MLRAGECGTIPAMLRSALASAACFSLLVWAFVAVADDPPALPASSGSAVTTSDGPVLYDETEGPGGAFERDFDGGYSRGDLTIGYIAVEGDADATSATTRVSARDLSLVGGRVTIAELTMAVSAGPGGTGVTEAVATGMRVDGASATAGPGARIDLAGFGALVMFEQVAPSAGAIRANALRLEPDGSGGAAEPISVGNLTAAAPVVEPPAPEPEAAPPPAQAPEPPPPPEPAPSAEPAPEPASSREPPANPAPRPPAPIGRAEEEFDPAPGATAPAGPRIGLPVRPAPPGVSAPDFGGYVFPVFGDNVSFGNDYGAPRAVTGWHHGNDLYAPTGTPVLAVADGELFLVGVNRLGGNRLWLRDDAGNEFYYAHLSAYTPLARDGARVRAGDPIGFIGNSGQAITTPPHLHFEVHPGGLDSVNPYPYLLAWQRRTDVPRAFREATVAVGQVPAAGALVIEITPDRDEPPKSESGLATPVS